MKNLFYSEKEKILFWIPGYAPSIESVIDMTTDLVESAHTLASITNTSLKSVQTSVITNSSRYKDMRMFWVEDVKPKDLPADKYIFIISDDWTMIKWIEN